MSEKRPETVHSWGADFHERTKRRGNAPEPPARPWLGKTPFHAARDAFDRLKLGRKGNAPADHSRPGAGNPGRDVRTVKDKDKPATFYGEEHRNHREGVSAHVPPPFMPDVLPQKLTPGVVTVLRFESPAHVEGWVKTRVEDFKAALKTRIEADAPGCTVGEIRIDGNNVFVEVVSAV